MTTTTTDTACRIYVASLSDYNAGRLVGAWVDIDGMDADDIGAAIAEVLANAGPGREEYAIHDYDGPLGKLANVLGEWPNMETLAAIVDGLSEWAHIDDGGPWLAWFDNHGPEYFDTADTMEDTYRGEWDSVEDYAYSTAAESCEDMGPYGDYIAWDRVARDLVLGGDIWAADSPGGSVYVFANY